MKRAFTLLELLVVIAIMGILGTVSISGYRSVTRGMEERGAIDNASRFIHSAFQRSMIDRAPVAVYYWNETVSEEDEDNQAVVVGKAVAIRRAGRVSRATSNVLYDEFADLNRTYRVSEDPSSSGTGMYLYQMSDIEDSNMKRSRVADAVIHTETQEWYLQDPTDGATETPPNNMVTLPQDGGKLNLYGFQVLDNGGIAWQNGDAYGFEFQQLTLPHNYIFGTQFNRTMADPVAGEGKLIFGGGGGGYSQRGANVTGTKTLQVSALRPDASGNLQAVKVGMTDDPTKGD